jgi:glycosyltransferase involved in cell wall biosynthesis
MMTTAPSASARNIPSSAAKRIAFIGNSQPRRCGIATFTSDLQQAVAASGKDIDTCIVAMTDHGQHYDYPPAVGFSVNDQNVEDYVRAAEYLNAGKYDVACLQHEFGIFGGDAGEHIMAMLNRLTMPVVTTLHTILSQPTPAQRAVLHRIVDASARIVVMAMKGRELLRTVYGVPPEKIDVIPHGIPDFEFAEPDRAKTALGYGDKSVILTFGLLNPNKGIEVMIDAMPAILKKRADAVYVVLGATHPNLVRHQGEAYRESLVARARALAVEDRVVFLNQFVDLPTLLGFISMCDVYVTPYLNEAQMTSGTLAYSFGLGKAVVSTPYWHARELLADNRGILVQFGDPVATGNAIAGLLTNPDQRLAMRKRAYASSRSMTWARTAQAYVSTFSGAVHERRIAGIPLVGIRIKPASARTNRVLPEMRLDHFLSMCDDTGLFQHASHSVPNRSHGYCIDDNARALLVACALGNPDEEALPEAMTGRFASFIQHAWNPETRHFRNFLSFDRCWLEARGSEDSHARTLWALGECARVDTNLSRKRWAAALFMEALPVAERFTSPRAWAFTLLGLDAFCTAMPPERRASADGMPERLRLLLADQLVAAYTSAATANWAWFESGLAYDNARLSQALIATGLATHSRSYTDIGVRSLRWLMSLQTSPAELFRPIGTDSFGDQRRQPHAFDQQPLEATATIAACYAAWRADGHREWQDHANAAFAWFLGDNDLAVALVDLETGSCRDGLHPGRANENRGGESVVSYLLALAEMRKMARVSRNYTRSALIQPTEQESAVASHYSNGESLVANHIPEPAGALPAPRSGSGARTSVQTGHRATGSQAH